jgi:N-hydroxyarylamine O-acetyltransferase
MSAEEPDRLDLDAYLRRIGYEGPRVPTRAVLEEVHEAHATHIPFENLDVLLGRPVRLDLAALQAKLVRGRRGGYCFEHNTLFAAALEVLGFHVTRLAARVRLGAARVSPRTHMLLEVDVAGQLWLADVGFGGTGPLRPLPMAAGRVAEHGRWAHRLSEDAGTWLLQLRRPDGWFDLYAFTREPQYPVDFEVANHYTATYPDSFFRHQVLAQRLTPEERFTLYGHDLTVERDGEVSTRTISDADDLRQTLSAVFDLHLPDDTPLPLPEAPAS